MGTIRHYRKPLESVEMQNGVIRIKEVPVVPELFDLRRWAAPPHLTLVHTKEFLAFTRRYGVLSTRPSGEIYFVRPDDVRRFQGYLRQAWEGNENVLEQMLVDVRASLRVLPTGLEIIIEDLWTLVRLMFLHDHFSGRTKICANRDCETRYFLAVRKSQKFCSPRCTVLINVRRFREREAKEPAPKKKQKHTGRKHAKAKKA